MKKASNLFTCPTYAIATITHFNRKWWMLMLLYWVTVSDSCDGVCGTSDVAVHFIGCGVSEW